MQNCVIQIKTMIKILSFIGTARAAVTEENLREAKDIGDYVTLLYKWGIPLGVALGSLVVIYAGSLYATSGGVPDKMTQAKDLIVGALIGLALIILAGVILSNIIGIKY